MRPLADRVILAEGWTRAAIAVGAGAFGALAMPPFGALPALAVSLSVAVWLLDGSAADGRVPWLATARRAAAAGWLWGFGYFVGGLWWIGAAFLVQADLFAWLMPFGVLGLPAVLAIFPAIGFALARLLWSGGPFRLFALAFGLAASEWLRGHAFTGFPWNTLGLALGQNLLLMQAASVIGMYGLTVLAILIGAAPALLGTERGRAGRTVPILLAVVLVGGLTAFGALRLGDGPVRTVPGVTLRIVQPNLPQDAKFEPAAGGKILRRYLALSDRATSPETRGLRDVTHVVWPESAFPFLLHREPAALTQIADALPRGASLITGAARSGDASGPPGTRYYNAIQVVADTGAITATYDKIHLVPFGEYVPAFLDRALRSLGLRQLVVIPGGFTPGERRSALLVPGLPPVAAGICYEAIFPDETMPAGPRPGLILNVTNDGWFGDTPGPRQHFAQARLRAVERGLPLVRSANTGISAIVDPYGRIVGSLAVGKEGVLDGSLPTPLGSTIFDAIGNMIFYVSCAGSIILALAGRRRHHLGRRRASPACY